MITPTNTLFLLISVGLVLSYNGHFYFIWDNLQWKPPSTIQPVIYFLKVFIMIVAKPFRPVLLVQHTQNKCIQINCTTKPSCENTTPTAIWDV